MEQSTKNVAPSGIRRHLAATAVVRHFSATWTSSESRLQGFPQTTRGTSGSQFISSVLQTASLLMSTDLGYPLPFISYHHSIKRFFVFYVHASLPEYKHRLCSKKKYARISCIRHLSVGITDDGRASYPDHSVHVALRYP